MESRQSRAPQQNAALPLGRIIIAAIFAFAVFDLLVLSHSGLSQLVG